MAMCEKCGKNGYLPTAMSVDPERDQFVGPCCADQSKTFRVAEPRGALPPMQVIKLPPKGDVEYGLEVSNKVGVRAFVNWAGFSLQFERTPTELTDWAKKNGFIDDNKRTA